MKTPTPDPQPADEVCVANIGGKARSGRLVFGLVMAAVAGGMVIALWAVGAPRLWRLGAALPVWMAAVGFLQYRGRT